MLDHNSVTFLLEDSKDLSSSDESNLGNSISIPKSDTDLRRSHTLLGTTSDDLSDAAGCESLPEWSLSSVRQSASGDTGSMHSSHCYFSL